MATVFIASFDGAGVTFPVVEAGLTDVVRAKASLLGLIGGRGAAGSLFGMIVASCLIASVTTSFSVANVEVSGDG